MKIKAITLWQHWASAMSLGEKRYETRSWGTEYRGLVAVHAALTLKHYNPTWMANHGISKVPVGCILSIHALVNIVPVETVRNKLSFLEESLGNYNDGRFAWEMPLLYRLPEPIPARGYQKLWTWQVPDDLARILDV